jgi:DNA-binding transcriptional regulator PaaX
MSAELAILEYLSKPSKTHNYKGVRVGLFGLPDFKFYKYQTLANSFCSLKTKGFVKESNGIFYITNKGEAFLEKKKKILLKKFLTEKKDTDPKDLLVLYDIPEDKKYKRDWFRRELINFHFVMIQKSVWVGPSPLPKEFLDYVKELGIKNNFKTFKLDRGYNK